MLYHPQLNQLTVDATYRENLKYLTTYIQPYPFAEIAKIKPCQN